MPFNQLLLPLIGGFLLVNFTHILSYWTSRQGREQLIFASALAGLVALVAARLVIVPLKGTAFGQALGGAVYAFAPYPGIGTALAAFLLCLVLRVWINWVWPREEAARWLYGTSTYNSLERIFFYSAAPVQEVKSRGFIHELAQRMTWGVFKRARSDIKRLWRVCTRQELDSAPAKKIDPLPVLLSLKDRKVYVGWLEWIPPLRANDAPYLRIFPVWSGYRDKDSLRVIPTEQYSEEVFGDSDMLRVKIIRTDELANVSLFDPNVFDRFSLPVDDGECDVSLEAMKYYEQQSSSAPEEQGAG